MWSGALAGLLVRDIVPATRAGRGWGIELRRGWLRVGAQRLYVRAGGPARGTGPPVVLLPGLAMSGRYLVPVAEELAASRWVVVPDLPGTGRSAHPPSPRTVVELADLVHRLVLGTVGGPAVVLGNSFGCPVAIELALRHPEAVDLLVLTGTVLAPPRDLGPVALRFLAAMRQEPPRYLALAAVDVARAWPWKTWANLRTLLSYPIEQRVARLGVPTLVVRGHRDRLVPARFTARLAACIPDGRSVEIPGAHALPYDAPRALAEVVLGAPVGR